MALDLPVLQVIAAACLFGLQSDELAHSFQWGACKRTGPSTFNKVYNRVKQWKTAVHTPESNSLYFCDTLLVWILELYHQQ